MSGIIILQKKTSYITTLRKIGKLCAICIVQGCSLGYSLLLKKSIQTYNLQQSCSVGTLGAKTGTYSNKFPTLPPF